MYHFVWYFIDLVKIENFNESILWFVIMKVTISGPVRFTLVDENGQNLHSNSGERGLLLYDGNTVCDDSFSDNSADAICREMGYAFGASEWVNGQFYDILQSNLAIGLDDVICSSDSWDSCEFITSHNCAHDEDVHLACIPGKLSKILQTQIWGCKFKKYITTLLPRTRLVRRV